jgi:hypothetical protein
MTTKDYPRSYEIRVSGYLTKQCAGDNIVEAYTLLLTAKNISVILLEKNI